MKRLLVLTFGMLCVLCMLGLPARGETITLTTTNSITDLLGSSYWAATPQMVTDMNGSNLFTKVYSEAYTNGSLYAYLYQVKNVGISGTNSWAELFTVWPFYGSIGSGQLGYLSGTVPADFLSGGQAPGSSSAVDPLAGGQQVSLYYLKILGQQINPGDHSAVMYITSPYGPGQISGNVIDGSVGTGPVYGAVPEPTAVTLLLAAGLGLLVCVRRQRQVG